MRGTPFRDSCAAADCVPVLHVYVSFVLLGPGNGVQLQDGEVLHKKRHLQESMHAQPRG